MTTQPLRKTELGQQQQQQQTAEVTEMMDIVERVVYPPKL